MAINLDKARTPSIKLKEKGQMVHGRVLHVAVVPWIEFGTDQVKRGKDGTPRTQEVVTLSVIKSTATKGDGEPVVPDEEVAVWLNGHRRWAWIEAKRAAKGLSVGDRVSITYTKDEPSKGGSPRKVWDFVVLRAKPDEAEQVAECEAAYYRLEADQAARSKDSGKNQPQQRDDDTSGDDGGDDDFPF